jgi:hypothetical protein
MIVAAAFDLISHYRPANRPFSRLAAPVIAWRDTLSARYPDLVAARNSAVPFDEVCNILIEQHIDGQTYVCFSANFNSADRTLDCPPGFVIEGLATGVYHEFLRSFDIAPEHIHFFDHVPAHKDPNPIWMDRFETPDFWRAAMLVYEGSQYNLANRPDPNTLIDPALHRGVPKLVRELPFQRPQRQLNLHSYLHHPRA